MFDTILSKTVHSELRRYSDALSHPSSQERWTNDFEPIQAHCFAIKIRCLARCLPQHVLPSWQKHLDATVKMMVGKKRIAEIFEIVNKFPTSLPAVKDLCQCFDPEGDLKRELIDQFKKQIQQRLLHSPSSTKTVVMHFLNMINTFTEIDPKGYRTFLFPFRKRAFLGDLVAAVSDMYKSYLRDRIDTMKAIVSVIADTQQEQKCYLEELAEADLDPNIQGQNTFEPEFNGEQVKELQYQGKN